MLFLAMSSMFVPFKQIMTILNKCHDNALFLCVSILLTCFIGTVCRNLYFYGKFPSIKTFTYALLLHVTTIMVLYSITHNMDLAFPLSFLSFFISELFGLYNVEFHLCMFRTPFLYSLDAKNVHFMTGGAGNNSPNSEISSSSSSALDHSSFVGNLRMKIIYYMYEADKANIKYEHHFEKLQTARQNGDISNELHHLAMALYTKSSIKSNIKILDYCFERLGPRETKTMDQRVIMNISRVLAYDPV